MRTLCGTSWREGKVGANPRLELEIVEMIRNAFSVSAACAGLAHALDLNKTGLRWVVALVTLFLSEIPAIVYIVLWAILKPRPTGISPGSKT